MIIVTTNNNELVPRNQVVYEIHQPAPSPTQNNNGLNNSPPSLSLYNTGYSAREQETISTQSSLFDTSSVYLTQQSSSASSSSSPSQAQGADGNGSSTWPLSSVSTGKGPSGRKPPSVKHMGPKKLVPLANYHNYLLCLGILSICVGFIRTLASIFLLWNSVEKVSQFGRLFCEAFCLSCLSTA